MMNSKVWVRLFMMISFWAFASIGISNFIVDPHQQYRISTFYPVHFHNQRYQNAGFAKNFQYDSALVGTSMSENFILSEVETLLNFNKALKLTISGGSSKEQSVTLQTAIDNNESLKNVVWEIHMSTFVGNVDRLRNGEGSFPFFLYDKSVLNDFKYIFSFDVLKQSVNSVLNLLRKQYDDVSFDYNKMFQWQHLHENEFTLQNVRNSWEERDNYFKLYPPKDHKFLVLKKNFDFNFLKIIKRNPQIEFKILFPPHSILLFKGYEERQVYNDILKFKKYILNTLSAYPNLEIYDFQIVDKITTDLSNYKDLNHYHQKVNTWMLNRMQNKDFLVTSKNIEEHLQILKKQVESFYFD